MSARGRRGRREGWQKWVGFGVAVVVVGVATGAVIRWWPPDFRPGWAGIEQASWVATIVAAGVAIGGTVIAVIRRRRGTPPGTLSAQMTATEKSGDHLSQRLGAPISQYTPVELEVHQAIDGPDGGDPSSLPQYVPRAHDARLRDIVAAAAGGSSQIAVLVGGSSTGKTRACWEAIRDLPSLWWLWHPIDPSRPAAAAQALSEVGPHTVVWLNEAQHYLLTTADPTLGARICAGLRNLLRDLDRGPVLILATIWPEYWATLTAPPPAGGPDPHAQARELLAGTDIPVPDAFTDANLQALQALAADDSRLRHAHQHAQAGRITQYLAGAPELLRRYRNAPPAARAVIDVATDAHRLGRPLPIPRALLEQAAPGYLSDHDWQQAGEGWLDQALAHCAAPCHGVPGPLTRIRPRPEDPPPPGAQPHYRLADYLEQTGRRERVSVFPPAGFWNAAAATITDRATLRQLAYAAEERGRYQRAACLYRQAADRGDTDAMRFLARLRERAGDPAGAEALAMQAADHGDTFPLVFLAEEREHFAGDPAGAETLYRQAADCGDTDALWHLARLRERGGDPAGAEALYRQAADRGDTDALVSLARLRERAGDPAGAEALAMQAADHGDTDALRSLAELRERGGDLAGAEALYRQAADRGDTEALVSLARLRERAGDLAGAEALAMQAADHGDTDALRSLAELRERDGDLAGAEALAMQAADLGSTGPLCTLAELRWEAGDLAGAEALAMQAADRGSTGPLLSLAELRGEAGDLAGAEALAMQAADLGNPITLGTLARLRERAGDAAGAEALAMQAADLGDPVPLCILAELRGEAGYLAGAEALYRQAADRGDTDALWSQAELREQAGDHTSAQRIRRYGLDDGGSPAESLAFELLLKDRY